jgi:hypothetical protein
MLAVVGVVLVAVLVTALVRRDGHARPARAEARCSDIRGQVEGALARFEDLVGTQVDGHNLIGPVDVRIAGKPIG